MWVEFRAGIGENGCPTPSSASRLLGGVGQTLSSPVPWSLPLSNGDYDSGLLCKAPLRSADGKRYIKARYVITKNEVIILNLNQFLGSRWALNYEAFSD